MSICLCVCLFHNYYDHTASTIAMKSGINILGTMAEQRMCEESFTSLPVQNGGRFMGRFCSYGQPRVLPDYREI